MMDTANHTSKLRISSSSRVEPLLQLLLLLLLVLVLLALVLLVLLVLLLVLDLLLPLLLVLVLLKASGALLAQLAKVFRLAATVSPLRLPRALPPAHRAYRPLLEVDRLARWTRRLA